MTGYAIRQVITPVYDRARETRRSLEARPVARVRIRQWGLPLTKVMVLGLGSGLPAYLVFGLLQEQDLMIRFWGTLVAFALGWWVSRTFVRNYLDL